MASLSRRRRSTRAAVACVAVLVVAGCGSGHRPTTAAVVVHQATAAGCPGRAPAGRLPAERRLAAPPRGTSDGTLVALDARTGRVRWRLALPMAEAALQVVGRNVIVKGDYGTTGTVYASVDRSRGTRVWRWPPRTWLTAQAFGPATADRAVVVAQGEAMTVLDARTGVPRWGERNAGGQGEALVSGLLVTPAGPTRLAYRLGRPTTRLVARDQCSRRLRWSTRTRLTDVAFPVASAGAVTAKFDLPSQKSAVTRVDARNGRLRWQSPLSVRADSFFLPVTGAVTLFGFSTSLGPQGNTRLALDPGTGRRLWRVRDSTFWFGPAEDGKLAFYLSGANRLEARAARTGRLRWARHVQGPSLAVVARDGLVVTRSGRGVEARSAATGRLLWRYAAEGAAAAGTGVWGTAVAGRSVYVFVAGTALPGGA